MADPFLQFAFVLRFKVQKQRLLCRNRSFLFLLWFPEERSPLLRRGFGLRSRSGSGRSDRRAGQRFRRRGHRGRRRHAGPFIFAPPSGPSPFLAHRPVLFPVLFLHVMAVDVRFQVRGDLLPQRHGFFAEHHQEHPHLVLQEECVDLVHRDAQTFLLRVPEAAGGDQREGQRADPVRRRQFQALPVAGAQFFLLALRAAPVPGADRVDDVLCGQVKAGGQKHLPLGHGPDMLRAVSQQLIMARRLIYGGVAAGPHAGRAARRVDDGFRRHFRDVVADDR